MKKMIIVFALMTMVTLAGFANTEDAEMYQFIYNAAATRMAQLNVLQNMAEANLSGMGDFYAQALRQLLSGYRNIADSTELYAATEQAILLSALLAAEKYTDAAPDLWLAVTTFSHPLVKSEAIMALGQIQATDYLPQVVRTLRNLNESSPRGIEIEHFGRIAFGSIISLEKFHDESGYLPVYVASTPASWYTKRVRDQAEQSLPVISSDPAPFITTILQQADYDFPAKLAAVQAIEASDVADDSKASIALVALSEGWRLNTTNDMGQRAILATMRKQAIQMIGKYQTTDETVYPLLVRSYRYGFDQHEKYDAVNTLSVMGTDDAIQSLSDFLMELNAKRQVNDIRQGDEEMVRRIIAALGRAKNSLAKPALNTVRVLDWNQGIKDLAARALGEIG